MGFSGGSGGSTLGGTPISITPPTDGQILVYDNVSGEWEPLDPSALGALTYQGTWNANTNTPTIVSSIGVVGYFWVVGVSGTTTIDGVSDWAVGDWIVFNGTIYQKADHTTLSIEDLPGKAADPQYPDNTIIFDPAVGATAGNVYKTWAEVDAAAVAMAGYPVECVFIGACDIPAGGPYRATGVHWTTKVEAPSTITIKDGASFDTIPASFGDNITIANEATTAPMTAPAGLTITPVGTFTILTSSAGADLLVTIPNGAVWAPMAGSKVEMGDGTVEVFGGDPGGTLFIFMAGSNCDLKSNSLKGLTGFTALTNFNIPSASVSVTQPLLVDGLGFDTGGEGAAVISYDPTDTGLVATVVADAIGELAPVPLVNAAAKDPNGFVDPVAEFNLQWSDATPDRTMTLIRTGGDYTYYRDSNRVVKTDNPTIQIADTYGAWFITFNSSDVLVASQTPWDFSGDAVKLAIVFWDKTKAQGKILWEAHTAQLNNRDHERHHTNIGTLVGNGLEISGYTIGLESDAGITVGYGTGDASDEDIKITPTHAISPSGLWEQFLNDPGQFETFYRDGAAAEWTWDSALELWMKTGGGRLYYNLNTAGTWSQTETPDNKFCVYWFAITNFAINPIVVIQGQAYYDKAADAEAAAWTDLDLSGLFSAEVHPLHRIIFRTKSTYAGTKKSRIDSVTDFRKVSTTPGSGVATSLHGGLPDLATSGHPADIVAVDTSAFSGNLSAADVDAQTALDTIDGLTLGGLLPQQFNFPPEVWQVGDDADWHVTNVAAITTDTNNAAIPVVLLPDAASTGFGFAVDIPTGATTAQWRFFARGETAVGGTAIVRMATRLMYGGVGAWASGVFRGVSLGADEDWDDESPGSDPIGFWGLTAGATYQIQVWREGTDGSDTLTTGLVISHISVVFS